MRLLGRRPHCRVRDIAEELANTIGGISKVVDRVAAAGYCRRRANPEDRRSSIVELTPIGQRLSARAEEVFAAKLESRIGSVLPERTLDHLATALAERRDAYRLGGKHEPARPTG